MKFAVTVIATGFGQEQQNEISNTEAKKIIHSLEDDQKIVHDLSEQDSPYIPLINIDEPITDQEEIFHQVAPINKDPIISMNEILYDIEVDVDEVFNGIEIKSDLKELLTEEEVLISEEDSNFKILEGEEIKNEYSPIESQNSNEIDEMTKNEFSETSEEQLFEPQFDSVSEIFEKDNIEKLILMKYLKLVYLMKKSLFLMM